MEAAKEDYRTLLERHPRWGEEATELERGA